MPLVFFSTQLTGYDLYQPLSQKADEQLKGRAFENALLKERNLRPDKFIKELLLELSLSEVLTENHRIEAFTALMLAHPPELSTIIEENLDEITKSELFFQSVLKNLSKLHFLPSLNLLKKLWYAKNQFSESTQLALVDCLGYLGTREILGEFTKDETTESMVPGFLLAAAFDEKNNAVREKINAVLSRENYAAEISKERYRREIFNSIEQEKQEGKGIAKNERQLQDSRINLQQQQDNYNDSSFRLDQAINRQDTFTLGAKIDLGIVATDTAKLRVIINNVLTEVARHERALAQTVKEINEKVAAAKRVQDEVINCEDRLIKKEELLKKAIKEVNKCEQDLKKWGNERERISKVVNDLDRRLNTASKEFSRTKSKYNTLDSKRKSLEKEKKSNERKLNKLDPENADQIKSFEREIANIKNKLSSVNRDYSSAESEFKNAKRNNEQIEKELSRERSKKQKFENNIDTARKTINRLNNAIPEYERTIKELNNKLNTLKNELNEVNRDKALYETRRQQQALDLNQIQTELEKLRDRFKKLERHQEDVLKSGKRGMSKLRSEIDKLNNQNNGIIKEMDELRNQMPIFEENIQIHKTNKQTLFQQIEDSREQYDTLGDQTHQESSVADARNRQRGEHARLLAQGKGREQILMNLRIKRSAADYRGRNKATTNKFQNKISKKV